MRDRVKKKNAKNEGSAAVGRKQHRKTLGGKMGKRKRWTDSPQRRKKCKCKNVQRVTRQRYDRTRWGCAPESPRSASKTERLPTHRVSCK